MRHFTNNRFRILPKCCPSVSKVLVLVQHFHFVVKSLNDDIKITVTLYGYQLELVLLSYQKI